MTVGAWGPHLCAGSVEAGSGRLSNDRAVGRPHSVCDGFEAGGPLAEVVAPALGQHVQVGRELHGVDVVAVAHVEPRNLGHPEAARVTAQPTIGSPASTSPSRATAK